MDVSRDHSENNLLFLLTFTDYLDLIMTALERQIQTCRSENVGLIRQKQYAQLKVSLFVIVILNLNFDKRQKQ